LKKDSWLIINSNTKTIFNIRNKEYWKNLLTGIDPKKYKYWTNVPENPSYN